MQPRRSESFPLYIESTAAAARDAVESPRLGRLVLAAWAGLVYLVYWLGYLGLR
jgi:hypothetical protein